MKKLVFLFILFFSLQILAQDFIKQITHINSDARNFKFLKTANQNTFGEIAEYVFESRVDSFVNIFFGYYNPAGDSFYNQKPITNNNSQNLNPTGRNFYGNNSFVIYQTNLNGNWDLAVQTKADNIWSDERILFNSSKNETDPVLFKDDEYWYAEDSVRFLYSSDNSVYLACWKDSITKNEEIFAGNDSTIYSSYDAAFFWIGWADPRTGHYIVAKKSRAGVSPQLVYRQKNLNGMLGPETILLESSNLNNPGFSVINFNPYLHYEDLRNGKINVLFFEGWPWSIITPRPLRTDPEGDLSDFTSTPIYIVTKENYNPKINDLYLFECHSFKQVSNDSTFIRVNAYDLGWHPDTLIYTRVSDTRIDVSEAGMSSFYFVFYTTWEDSADGKTSIFGRRHLFDVSSVEDERGEMSFQLYQNYPNPFNPSTTIVYKLTESGWITIKVYDILGNEIRTLLSDEQNAGEYKINFDGSGLTSGVYFYRLQTGNSIQSKKMILIK